MSHTKLYYSVHCVYDNNCPSISFNSAGNTSFGWQIDNMEGETILEYNIDTPEIGNYCSNYCFEDGCYIITMTDTWGSGWFGTTLNIGEESFTLQTGSSGIAAFAYNSDIDCEIGCTDAEASNYNENAILDDGSCVIFGCTIVTACNYNPEATAFDGSCEYCYLDDCVTYPNDSYDCDGNCADQDQDGVCDSDEIEGCLDEEACNYDSNATDEGDCEYPDQYYDCDGLCLNDTDGDQICNELDNCPLVYNPNQEDMNNDGVGDDCDGISLDEHDAFNWIVYPNPFKDYTTIKFTNPERQNFAIKVITLSGKIIEKYQTKATEYIINKTFSPGYYIIQLESNTIIVRKTLIVQ